GGGFDNLVRLWDAATGKPLGVLEGHTGAVRRLAYSPDGQTLASASFDGTVRLWDVSAGAGASPRRVIEAHGGGLNGLAFSPDGKTLFTGGKRAGTTGGAGSGELAAWDVATGKEKARATGVVREQLLSLAISPD